MAKKMIHLAILLAIISIGLLGAVTKVSADGGYHTEQLSLEPVNGAPLHSGFVVNLHANGPNIYAKELYQLNGAAPNTSYQVILSVFISNTSCSGDADLVMPTAVLSTNASGNAQADHVFTPADAAGLRGSTVGGQWQIWNGNTLDYQTECTTVTLD